VLALTIPVLSAASEDTGTYALWNQSDSVTIPEVATGDLALEPKGESWSWTQLEPFADPIAEPPDEGGTCLTAADGDVCSDGSAPLSALRAMPGDVVELRGLFEAKLAGHSVAARLRTWFADAPTGWGNATYSLSASPADGVPVWEALASAAVGAPITVVTVSDAAALASGVGGPDAVVLPDGIHQASDLLLQVTVRLEVVDADGAAAYPYQWVDPLSDPRPEPSRFTVPELTVSLEQIRAGEKFGVAP
jgi:hypothetical protein